MIRFVDYNNDKKEACYSFCAVSENNQCAERVYGHCPFAGAVPAVVCQCGIKKNGNVRLCEKRVGGKGK